MEETADAAAREADEAAETDFAAYAERSWGTLVRSAVFLGAGAHEAEDLAQTTLVRCFTAWPRVVAADDRDAYVYRMLLNCLRDSRRRRWWGERPTADLPEPDAARSSGFADPADAVDVADAVHRALRTLSKPNRDVVVLRYFAQLTERQTADALGVPPGTVKSRLSRSIAVLAVNDHLLDLAGRSGGPATGTTGGTP